MNLESQIWMFRTRSGNYRIHGESDDSSDILLQEQVEMIKKGVLEGADIKTTSFFGNFESPNLHQQHPKNYRNPINTDIAKANRLKHGKIHAQVHESSDFNTEQPNLKTTDSVDYNTSRNAKKKPYGLPDGSGGVPLQNVLNWLGNRDSENNIDDDDDDYFPKKH